jgi:hypothetical protein
MQIDQGRMGLVFTLNQIEAPSIGAYLKIASFLIWLRSFGNQEPLPMHPHQ